MALAAGGTQKETTMTRQHESDAPDGEKPKKRRRVRRPRGMGCVYERGRTWWIKFRLGSEWRFESSESVNKGDAEDLLKKRLGEVVERRVPGRIGFVDMERMLLDDMEA